MTLPPIRQIVPLVPIGVLLFGIGAWCGRITDANAQKVDASVFKQYASEQRLQYVADSIRDDMRWSRQDERWEQYMRSWRRVMCRTFKECDL